MKTILFPTDFSENAQNALDYAIEMTRLLKGKLVLFHAYELPYSTHSMSTTLLSLMKQEAEKQLQRCVDELKVNASDLEVETILRQGNAIRSVVEVSDHCDADFIIMGTKGASGMKEVFVGSNTASVMHRANVPVLVVPESARFRMIDKIVYASDFLDSDEVEAVNRLKEFAKMMHAEVLVLHVSLPDDEHTSASQQLKENLADINHSFYVESNGDIEEGIRTFVENKGADILVMLARKHSMLDLIFNPVRLTKRMAYHPDLPLLMLHES